MSFNCSSASRIDPRIPETQVIKTATATTEILDPAQPDSLCVSDDPWVRAAFEQHLSARWFSGDSWSDSGLLLQWRNALPVDGAFAVFVRVDGQDHAAGHLLCRQGSWNRAVIPLPKGLDGPECRSIHVVLRADPALARDTVDVEKIWGGELVLGPVIVEGP